jgi:hypothetical protein
VFAALVYLHLIGRGGRTTRQTALLALAVAIAGGALVEVLQALGGERDPTIVDVIVDAAGAVVAVVALSWARVSPRTWARVAAVVTAVMLVVVVPAVIFATPDEPDRDCDPVPIAAREESELATGAVPTPVAAYTFDDESGRTVGDSAGSPALSLDRVGRTSWIEGRGLELDGGAAKSASPAATVVRAARASGEVTILARVRPARLDQSGPARIVTISNGPGYGQVNAHLGQDGRSLSVRIRVTCGDFNWTTVPDVFTSTRDVVGVAVTFGDDTERVYVDGEPVAAWRMRGTLRNWDPSFPLVVGNEATLDRPFVGDVFDVQVYDRALTAVAKARDTAGTSR